MGRERQPIRSLAVIALAAAAIGCSVPPNGHQTIEAPGEGATPPAGAQPTSVTGGAPDAGDPPPAAASPDPFDAAAAAQRSAELDRAAALRRALAAGAGSAITYRWLDHPADALLVERVEAPPGARRVALDEGSFGDWLRHLPLKPAGSPVLLYDGTPKGRQDVHVAVFDIDVGSRDRQQCADAVMRLRAEYLWAAGRAREICFAAVSGKRLRWRGGSAQQFRNYLGGVFAVANSASLLKELDPVADRSRIEPGDVFIVPAAGGMFGHAVTVMDVAEDRAGQRLFLLSQSYMPAQEIHLLKNPRDPQLSPWYRVAPDAPLDTPEWTFAPDALRRFPARSCGG